MQVNTEALLKIRLTGTSKDFYPLNVLKGLYDFCLLLKLGHVPKCRFPRFYGIPATKYVLALVLNCSKSFDS